MFTIVPIIYGLFLFLPRMIVSIYYFKYRPDKMNKCMLLAIRIATFLFILTAFNAALVGVFVNFLNYTFVVPTVYPDVTIFFVIMAIIEALDFISLIIYILYRL